MINSLVEYGIANAPRLPVHQVDDIVQFLNTRDRYGSHVERDRPPYGNGDVACWSMESLLAAPHFFEFALSFTNIASEYLDMPARMYSINAFETYPSSRPTDPYIQEFHVDHDDIKFVALFVYLTDIMKSEDGAHQYIMGSHKGGGRGITEMIGERGTAFLSDGSGLHRGVKPTRAARRIAWARWGVSPVPHTYNQDGMKPVSRVVLGDRYPTDRAMQESIKLVVC